MTHKHLYEIRNSLRIAAAAERCPPCAEDIRKLERCLNGDMSGIASLKRQTKVLNVAMGISKYLAPLFRVSRVDKKMVDIYNDSREGEKIVNGHLTKAWKLYGVDDDIGGIMKTFIKASQFKIDQDAKDFWTYDKMVKFAFRYRIIQTMALFAIA